RMTAGVLRCHEGQALDVGLRVTDLAPEEVVGMAEAISRLKTGGLMRLAAELGATAGGASPARVEVLGAFGERLGIALQMLDDLGGITHPGRHHKGLEDLSMARVTWPFAWASERLPATAYARLLTDLATALEQRASLEPVRDSLACIEAQGRERVAAGLATAFGALRSELGEREELGAIEREMERLRRSYG